MDSIAVLSLVSGTFFYFLSLLPWSAAFLFTRCCGIRYYVIKDSTTCQAIQRKIHGRSSATSDNDQACGYSYGRWYCLYLQHTPDDTAWIISTHASFERLSREKKEECIPIVTET